MYVALFTSSMLLESFESEKSRPFVQATPKTFGAAEASPGFIWLAPLIEVILDKSGQPKRVIPSFYEDPHKVVQTLSVWKDIPSAWNYVYRGTHLEALRKRGEWMQKPVHAQYVLWWCQPAPMPTHIDGVQHLERLDSVGPTPNAFNFRTAFSVSGQPAVARE